MEIHQNRVIFNNTENIILYLFKNSDPESECLNGYNTVSRYVLCILIPKGEEKKYIY